MVEFSQLRKGKNAIYVVSITIQYAAKLLSFRDRFGILLVKRLGGVTG